MGVQLTTRRFTTEEYHRMGEAGIFSEEDRVELLDGEIVEMSPIGSRHAACVSRLNRMLIQQIGELAIVSVQNPIRLSMRSEPQPDIAVLRPRHDFYGERLPGPQDVMLLIEVADTTAETDRQIKLPLYQNAGIGEVWIIDLLEKKVEVYREPTGTDYSSFTLFSEMDRIAPQKFPSIELLASEILP